MNKRLLLSAFLGLGCLGLYAETSTIEYSYADGDLLSYGTAKREIYDVAMCINNPALEGMKITEIKALINVTDGISEPSLWLSSDLVLEKKVNAPDICAIPVQAEETKIVDPITGEEYSLGMLSCRLETPYILTDKPVYVGYSLTIDNIDDDEHKNPVILSIVSNNEGFYFHSNKTALHWTNYAERLKAVANIYVTIESEISENALGIKTSYPTYVPQGKEYTVKIDVNNTGSSLVKNISYNYKIDDTGESNEGFIELSEFIEPGFIQPTSLYLPLNKVDGLGKHIISLEINKVNGEVNSSVAKNTEIEINVMPFVPKHRPLIEEYTGLWCQYCTRGYIGMELINEIYGSDQVSICYHNNDDMMVTTVYPMDIEGYPMASIDREFTLDPYYGTHKSIDFGIRKDVDAAIDQLALADLELYAEFNGSLVEVTSNTRFVINVENGNYQVGYVLTSNNLNDPSWRQTNAYAGATGFEGTYLEEATKWNHYAEGLIFNDVAVDVAGMTGIKGSLPADMNLGDTYSHSFTFDITHNNVVKNVEDLAVVGFIIDKNTGRIVNSNKFFLNGENSVNEINTETSVVAAEYYDLMGRKVSNPDNGIFICIEKMSDGTFRSAKVRL